MASYTIVNRQFFCPLPFKTSFAYSQNAFLISLGLGAGTFASCANIPFDVAKSRIQGPQPVIGQVKSSIQGPQPVIGQATYRTCFATIATVAKEEGVTALYRGLVPKVMRLGPGGAIMLLLYEYAYNYLEERFLK